MKQEHFHCSITANISAAEAVNNINRVADWWTNDFEGSASKLNDVFTIRFGTTFSTFTITEIIPGKKIVWLVNDCNLDFIQEKKEWKGTEIVWEISTTGNSTQIDFTHVGLVPGIECYDNCVKGWTFYVTQSLYKLITTGTGLPETPKQKIEAEVH